MKTLNNLNLNSEHILNNEELLTLKGGTQWSSWLTCRVDGVICFSSLVPDCDNSRNDCNLFCGPWTEAICGSIL